MNILITGASRGIGAAALDALKSAGHSVVGHSTLGSPELIAGDLQSPLVARDIWIEAESRLGGRIDVLINNAGIYEPAFPETEDDYEWEAAWSKTLAINLQAAAHLCRFAVQHFRSIGGGRIVNVASRAAFRGDSPNHWHYAASKGAMVAMTRTIARGYAAEGILCFAVAPGFTVSEMTEEYLTGRGGAQILADIPLGRVASTTEIGEIIRWLATEARLGNRKIIDAHGASYVRSLFLLMAAQISIPLGKPRRSSSSRPIEKSGPLWASQCRLRRLGQGRAPVPHHGKRLLCGTAGSPPSSSPVTRGTS